MYQLFRQFFFFIRFNLLATTNNIERDIYIYIHKTHIVFLHTKHKRLFFFHKIFIIYFLHMDTRLVWIAESVDALYTLLDKDPFLLEKINTPPLVHSPLHEACIHGKRDMALELIMLMPCFARKLNPRGFSPLHLAGENRQFEVAKELIKFDPTLIRLCGRGGVTPLHVVAKKGDADLLTVFLSASPMSILDANANGETALHIAVSNARDEELNVIIGWLQRNSNKDGAVIEDEVLNKQNRDGNTVLHVAAYNNNQKAVKALLRCLSLDRNIRNDDGFTPLDILRANGQMIDKETESITKRSGGKCEASLAKVKTASERFMSPIGFWEFCSIAMIRFRSRISDGNRNALLVITTLVIMSTYDTTMQPARDVFDLKQFLIAVMVVFYGFNTMAFMLALAFTLIILPPGSVYIWGYLSITVPLICSYVVEMLSKRVLLSLLFPIPVLFIIGSFSLLYIYMKWKLSRA